MNTEKLNKFLSPELLRAIKLSKSGNYEKALLLCKRIRKKNEKNPLFFNLLGIIYRRLGEYRKAKTSSLRALQIDSELVQGTLNLALIELDKDNFQEAISLLKDLVEIKPDYYEAFSNLALAYKKSGVPDKAVEIYKKVESFEKVEKSKAKFNYGCLLISLLDLREGWKRYESRWIVEPQSAIRWPIQDRELWRGEPDKRVVIWKEQGIGDDIIFLGLIPEARERCQSLSVFVDPRLKKMCERSIPGVTFLPNVEALQEEEFDYHIPTGSLPGLMRNDISDFDRTVTGYLKADPERVELLGRELGFKGKRIVGISWKSFKSLNQTKKSVDLKDFEQIFKDLDVTLLNLQYGDIDEELQKFSKETGIEVIQCSSVDNREDLDGLAALIELCDLVVSTSNVTIHMAGALGKETWVLLPYVANFWWLLDRTDSVWYPSLRLYRQKSLNDWESVFPLIRKDLQDKFG